MTENSAEMAGGTAYGANARKIGAGDDSVDLLSNLMVKTGEWVLGSAGYLLGHIKMALDAGNNGAMTLNLTDLDTGVERHGSISFPTDLHVKYMSAVLDVDQKELSKLMDSLLTSNGFTVIKENKNIIELK